MTAPAKRPHMTHRRVFSEKYVVDEVTGCWNWLGVLDAGGYGAITINYRRIKAHRASYEMHVAPIPDGLVIDHLCRNRACVNPQHLEPVTGHENTRRALTINGAFNDLNACHRGHEWNAENPPIITYRPRFGEQRRCRLCKFESDRARSDSALATGVCAACGRRYTLNSDGKLRRHNRVPQHGTAVCRGSRQMPKDAS